MPDMVTKKLGTYIGAEVLDVDRDRLLADDDVPQACLEALEEHSVLLLRELNIDDETQAAFCRKLGKLVRFPHYATPEVMEISFDPDNPNAEYFASNDYWHIDGALDAIPAKASILTAHVPARVPRHSEHPVGNQRQIAHPVMISPRCFPPSGQYRGISHGLAAYVPFGATCGKSAELVAGDDDTKERRPPCSSEGPPLES